MHYFPRKSIKFVKVCNVSTVIISKNHNAPFSLTQDFSYLSHLRPSTFSLQSHSPVRESQRGSLFRLPAATQAHGLEHIVQLCLAQAHDLPHFCFGKLNWNLHSFPSLSPCYIKISLSLSLSLSKGLLGANEENT